MMNKALLLLLLIALVAVSADPKTDPNYFEKGGVAGGQGASREEVKANLERRKGQLKKMLDEHHDKLAKHHAGEDLIEDEHELDQTEKRIDIIQRKLERMEDMDEREFDRVHRREERRWQRRRSRSREL